MEKVLVSIKISAGEKSYKYFIRFLYECNKIKPFHIMLPKMSGYVKVVTVKLIGFFLLENNGLLEKYNTIWDRANADIKK